MNSSIKLSKAISYIVLLCAALLFLAVWPGEFITQKYVSKSNEIHAMESDPVNVEKNITQMFVAEGGELSAVDLYVCNDMRGETITFRLYDSSYTEIFNTFYTVKENQKYPDFLHIPVGYDLIKDQEYYFTLEGLSADMTVAYEERETSTSVVNGFMSYGGIEIQRFNVIIRYEYRTPFAAWQILLIGMALAAGTAGVCVFLQWGLAKKAWDREVNVHTAVRVVFNPVVLILGVVLCAMVFPGRKFGTGVFNYVFYGGSILLLMLLLLYVINYKRTSSTSFIAGEDFLQKLPGYLQSVCIAVSGWYCYEYMNGLYEIHHSYATRKMLIWFFLSLLCTYSKKELLRIVNAVYLVIVAVAAYFYAKPYLGMEEEGTIYQLNAWLLVIGGLVLLLLAENLISLLRGKKSAVNTLSIPYVVLFALLMGCMTAFRNQRDWILVLVVIFVVFYLRMWLWEQRDRISEIVTNGLIFNFIAMVVYSLLHRPYHRYYFYRYALGYHTVTMTGVYLSLVLSALLAKLLLSYQKKRSIAGVWPQLSLVGIANVYLFMTLSRTGYLASVVLEIVIVIVFVCRERTEKWKTLAKLYGMLAAATVVAFCPVFTMTRILPAIVDDPILSDVEMTEASIRKGTPSDSELYMDLPRFFEVAGIKMTGDYNEARMLFAPEDIFILNDTILLASADAEIADAGTLDNLTNGRIEIFKAYIENWNLTGHEDMGVLWWDGTMTVHAHNVFLQVIHDNGLPTGILFLLFGVVSFVLAAVRFLKKKEEACLLTMTILLTFALSGLAEWNFHLCNPYGTALFMAVTPLLFKSKDIRENEQKKEF